MFGAALGSANNQGLKNYANLLQFNQAMQDMKRQALARQQLGDYLQSMVPAPATAAPAPAPGTASVPMTQPKAAAPPAATQPQNMSLDGLMGFLKDRNITGEDALATAEQFQPWLKAEDAQKLGQMKFQLDMEKLLIANGFDQQKAKNEAARIAAYNKRTQAMYGKGGQRDKYRALSATVQQLSTGRQKLEQQRNDIVNGARNSGRMLTPQEQATIQQINTRIQTVDSGMEAARQQQALLMGGLNYGGAPDSMDQPDTSTDSAAGVDTNLDGGGGD